MKKFIVLFLIVLIIAGCSSNRSGESKLKELQASDLCVTHVNLGSEICYGDDRVDVEKITGLTIDSEPYFHIGYKDGISIIYRDNKVVSLSLEEKSLDVYEIKYATIGESKTNIENRLGSEIAYMNAPYNLDYFYNAQTKEFLSQTSEHVEPREALEKVYILSIMFDSDGNAYRIMVIDARIAIYME